MKPWLDDSDDPRCYFAYGSNMSSRRLLARIPAASALGRARCSGYRVVCNKPSLDGSGKANLVESPAAAVWGVVYRVAREDWLELDRYEPGYTRHLCRVGLDDGSIVRAGVYLWLGEPTVEAAWDWYRDHLLHGAREHGLPHGAIEQIRSWATRRDPKRSR
ncbi:MAG: gamma-glutamylcyclotransferase [Deltaproteobacteria bacterium]|nr:gamma-glutamylcyclotransferase [Deltaproteobacteria bacterium]MBW2418184.1 gamma-glutamylcyclotransferase [Deltaproteobacteria bacterium]